MATLEASVWKMMGFRGSKRCKIGAVVNARFSSCSALSASNVHSHLLAFFNRSVIGAVNLAYLRMKRR